jgi:glycosyltransferase involved in cell wall biosynthesis
MPKVLRIINRLNLGGPTYNAAYLTKHLQPDFETMLLAGMKNDSEESSEFIVRNLGLAPIYIPEMKREINIGEDRKAYKKIKEIIGDFKPDIVHTHAAKAGALGRLAANELRVPVILHTFHGHVFHSYFSLFKSRLFVKAERYLASLSSGIIAISELQKKELSEKYKITNPEKIHVIPLGFDLQRFNELQDEKRFKFRQDYNLSEETVAVGIIGRLVPVKNHLFFLHAVKRILSKDKNVKFFIIGDGEERENTVKAAFQLNIDFTEGTKDSPLVFTSWIREIDIAYAGLDIVVLTSLNEGTPVSLIEAQAAGKPVVSTRVGGVENIVKHEESGFLADSGDLNSFVDQLNQLIQNKRLREEMGKKGKELIFEKFQYSKLVENTRSLYFDLLSKSFRR